MVPKSKRAKRRNRRKKSFEGYRLYWYFRGVEGNHWVTNVTARDTKFKICARFDYTYTVMIGGKVKHG